MSRLVLALALLVLAAPGAASAFSKQDRLITMSDGVEIATRITCLTAFRPRAAGLP